MNKPLGIIGVGLVVGVVGYVLLNRRKKTMDDIITAVKADSTDISEDKNVSIINQNNIHGESANFVDVKFSTLGTMSARHEDASRIMKNAVEIICKRSEVSEDENRELDQISDELLSEE